MSCLRMSNHETIVVVRGCGSPLGAHIVLMKGADWRHLSNKAGSNNVQPGQQIHPLPADEVGAQHLVAVNFAIHTRTQSRLYLMIFPPINEDSADATVTRDILVEVPVTASTGEVRHVCVSGLYSTCAYGYRIEGIPRVLHDIHSRFLESRGAAMWGRYEGMSSKESTANEVKQFLHRFETLRDRCKFPFRLSRYSAPQSSSLFDWGTDTPPNIPLPDLVIYEAHVRGLTAACAGEKDDPLVKCPGTFAAAISRIKYLKSLGITAVQLLPISEFNELETSHTDELKGLRAENCCSARSRSGRINFWGYSPVQPAAFAPMNRYGTTVTSAPSELKAFVKALHSEGMECFLDVIYNHVAGPSCPLHFLDVHGAYFMHPPGEVNQHLNVSGCGNTLAPNRPAMQAIILDSLRWWVSEYHVDGFRLDAGGVLAREGDGHVTSAPSVLRAIAEDPLLANVKLIVEPWDAGEAVESPNYLNGCYPYGDRFLEWNPDYMRVVRRFIRGDAGSSRAFCKALRGSSHMFRDRAWGSSHSVNFLSCHDGFCLADVVTYTERTNSDGLPGDTTCNYGVEGVTSDEAVNMVRARQVRNMILALSLSRGTPMLTQGDELFVSKHGNNNSYDEDSSINYLPADVTEPSDPRSKELLQFTRDAFQMRRRIDVLRGTDFYDAPGTEFCWYTSEGMSWNTVRHSRARVVKSNANCVPESTKDEFVAFYARKQNAKALFAAFNASDRPRDLKLPLVDKTGMYSWRLHCNTAASDGMYFRVDNFDTHEPSNVASHCMEPYTAVVYIVDRWNHG